MQSILIPKGYKASVPVFFKDNIGRTLAHMEEGEWASSNEEVATAEAASSDSGFCVEITAHEEGQAEISYRVESENPDQVWGIDNKMMVTVVRERQTGEIPQDCPTQVHFDVDRAVFEGSPKAEDPEAKERREQRKRDRADAENESRQMQENQEDNSEAGDTRGKTPEQIALEQRGPVTQQNASGAELAQRAAAEGASQHGQTAISRPEGRANPGNQGGGDPTGERQEGNAARARASATGVARPNNAASAVTSTGSDQADHHDANKEDEKKAQSAQQRGGSQSVGSTTSAPGSKRG